MAYSVQPGRRYPPGASLSDEGINFSVYSRHATGATLLLYADAISDDAVSGHRTGPGG
jgi:isoamylase